MVLVVFVLNLELPNCKQRHRSHLMIPHLLCFPYNTAIVKEHMSLKQ